MHNQNATEVRRPNVMNQIGTWFSEQLQAFHEAPVANRLVRFIGGSAVISILATGLANATEYIEGAHVGIPPKGPEEHSRIVEGRIVEVPGSIRIETQKGPGQKLDELQKFAPEFKAHKLVAEQKKVVHDYIDALVVLRDSDPNVERVLLAIVGESSDEDARLSKNGDRNLSLDSINNDHLSGERGALVAREATSYIKEKHIEGIEIVKVSGKEQKLNPAEIAEVDSIASKHKLSRSDLISAYNAGTIDLTAQQTALLDEYFQDRRGARITSEIERQIRPNVSGCDIVVQLVKLPDTMQTWVDPGYNGVGGEIMFLPGYVPVLRRKKQKNDEPIAEEPKVAEPSSSEAIVQTEADETVAETVQAGGETPKIVPQGAGSDSVASTGWSLSPAEIARYKRFEQRQLAREARYDKIDDALPLLGRLGLGLVPLAFFVPFLPVVTSQESINEADPPLCYSADVRQVSQETWGVISPLALIMGWFSGTPAPMHQLFTLGESDLAHVTTTRDAHKRIIVDTGGNIVSESLVPASVVKLEDVPALWSKK